MVISLEASMFFRSNKDEKKKDSRATASKIATVLPTVAASKPVIVRRVHTPAGSDPEFSMLTRLLMLSPEHQNLKLADLSWLVLPALQTRQALIAVARNKGQARSTGAVLWALVSAEVDRRLSAQLDQPLRLQPQEWTSGDILWIVVGVGDPKVVEGLMRKLSEGPFKGRTIKMRGRGADGKMKIVSVGQKKAAS
jgi:hemolysin-activating ACP:hemolysin acyltransferase